MVTCCFSCLLATQQEVSVSCVHLPVVGTDEQAVDLDDGTDVFLGGTLARGSNKDVSDTFTNTDVC